MKAGFARVDITPPLGSYISGYFKPRYAKGVLDPLELNAIAFSDGEATALLIVADLIGVDRATCRELRAAIAAETGVPAEHIMLTALHQHTAYAFLSAARKATRKEYEVPAPTEEVYEGFLRTRYLDVAKLALADMGEATLTYGTREVAEPIAFVRRYYMKDGTVATNPGASAALIDRPCDEPDNTVRLLRFCREGKRDIALVNFCTHPDVIAGEYLSADWPGFARRYVERDLQGVSCLLLNGAQGDSNHLDFMHGTRTGYAHADFMGRTVADAAVALFDTAAPVDGCRVAGGERTVVVQGRTDGIEECEECRRILREHVAGTLGRRLTMAEFGHAGRVSALLDAPAFRKIPVAVLRLGPFAFVGFGGEPFTQYPRGVQAAHPEVTVISACCANGYEGYLPTEKALLEGGYEAAASPFPKSIERDCVGAASTLIATL